MYVKLSQIAKRDGQIRQDKSGKDKRRKTLALPQGLFWLKHPLTRPSSLTGNFVSLQIWVCIEVNTIITTGSFPCLFPLLKMLYRKRQQRLAHADHRHLDQQNNKDPDSGDSGDSADRNPAGGAGGGFLRHYVYPHAMHHGHHSSGTGGSSSSKTPRSTDSQELSILKVQDYHVSVHEGKEEEGSVQEAIPGRYYEL